MLARRVALQRLPVACRAQGWQSRSWHRRMSHWRRSLCDGVPDQAPLLLLTANSSCPAHPLAWLGNPCSLRLAALRLTFCFSQHGHSSVACLGATWELGAPRNNTPTEADLAAAAHPLRKQETRACVDLFTPFIMLMLFSSALGDSKCTPASSPKTCSSLNLQWSGMQRKAYAARDVGGHLLPPPAQRRAQSSRSLQALCPQLGTLKRWTERPTAILRELLPGCAMLLGNHAYPQFEHASCPFVASSHCSRPVSGCCRGKPASTLSPGLLAGVNDSHEPLLLPAAPRPLSQALLGCCVPQVLRSRAESGGEEQESESEQGLRCLWQQRLRLQSHFPRAAGSREGLGGCRAASWLVSP